MQSTTRPRVDCTATKLGLSVASEPAEDGAVLKINREEVSVTFGKRRAYRDVVFQPEVFENAISAFEAKVGQDNGRSIDYRCTYLDGNDETSVRDPDSNYRAKCFTSRWYTFFAYASSPKFMTMKYERSTLDITIDGISDLNAIDEILSVFEKTHESSKIPLGQALKNLTVFIGHGRSRQWRDLKDHLSDHHGINVEAYETGARAGLTIQEILQDLSSKASLALLVHTGEDIDGDGQLHARENVVHETGIFQAKLGFRRAIVLLEDGTNEFSNIAGLQQLRFKKDNIKENFGDVLAIIRREFSGK